MKLPNLRKWLKTLRFPVSGGRNIGGRWFGGLLPGTRLDYAAKVGDRWRNSVVAIGLNWIINSFPEAPLTVQREIDGENQVIPRHPLIQFIKRPNLFYTYRTMLAGLLVSLICDGNAYLLKIRNNGGGVAELWYVPHFQMSPQWDTPTEFITRYGYTVDGQTSYYAPSEVVHIRNGIDPRNTRRGLSPLAQQDRQTAGDNEGSTYHASILENFGIPGVVVMPVDANTIADEEEAKRIKEKFHGITTGDSRGEPLVFSTPIKMDILGFNPQELMLDKMDAILSARILASMGLDPMVTGLPSPNKTYSNYSEAMRGGWRNAILPLMALIADQLTFQLLPDFSQDENEFVAFDTANVLALQDDQNALAKRLVQMAGGAVMTVNEARRRLALVPLGAEYDAIREKGAEVDGETPADDKTEMEPDK